MADTSKQKIICLLAGPNPLPEQPGSNEFFGLSEHLEGYILSPIWHDRPESDQGANHKIGNFEYYTVFSYKESVLRRFFKNLRFYVMKGWELHRSGKRFDVIMSYGPYTTALAGVILKWLTGAKLIVEFAGNPTNGFLLNRKEVAFIDRVKSWVAKIVCPIVIELADHVRVMYPTQLDGVAEMPSENRRSSFHYFTPVSTIPPSEVFENYILCLGGPYFRKGVDVVIRAFGKITDEFPDVKLRIIGFGPDESYYKNLASKYSRIEMLPGVPNAVALEHLSRCRLLACPSRAEGMPRVIVEAMAAGKPVVASTVDGIPFYVKHEENALLFKSEDVDGLAQCLRRVLSDEILAARLSRNGREHAVKNLSDGRYIDSYVDMVKKTLAI
ncbi:MAG: glycosyltransferase family 4 protein [Bdellovibrionales bacterium]|nr:glycosyltransferase family 4 protein [Bdellovibrionales bacterium]